MKANLWSVFTELKEFEAGWLAVTVCRRLIGSNGALLAGNFEIPRVARDVKERDDKKWREDKGNFEIPRCSRDDSNKKGRSRPTGGIAKLIRKMNGKQRGVSRACAELKYDDVERTSGGLTQPIACKLQFER